MKLLILTQYFPPEVGAPQNRLFELAIRLQKMGIEVTVLTAMPNYPQMKIYPGYEGKKYHFEMMEGLSVHRSSIFIPSSKSIPHRLLNYFSFVFSSARCGIRKIGDVDIILCESPPLFLGWSALYLKSKKKAKLIFNVSDLWPESAEKLGVVTNKWALKLAYRLEKKIYLKSNLISGQTQGICNNIKERFPTVKTFWLPNSADINYYNPAKTESSIWRKKNGFKENDLLFLYAGIIGIAQGLEIILHAANELQNKQNLKFILLGSGPEKEKLQILKKELNLSNVYFLDAVTKEQMPEIIASIDVSIIPLKKMDLFLGAIPSKIFENLAMEKPVILGVDGEARRLFIEQGNCGIYVEPENKEQLVNAIYKLSDDADLRMQLGKNGRRFVTEFFNRDAIAEKFYNELLNL